MSAAERSGDALQDRIHGVSVFHGGDDLLVSLVLDEIHGWDGEIFGGAVIVALKGDRIEPRADDDEVSGC